MLSEISGRQGCLRNSKADPGELAMADAELAVSVGDLVMVKGDDGKPKTQVILQLQPITQGMCEDSAETETAVVAVDTHQDDVPAEGEVEYGYPITCGDSKAILLFKKFVCPGINVKCVKYNDQLISPKQFVHLAGKATLKDWKRAIRLGGVMLRKMMDSGQIDFYQHDTVCTNTCRSTKFDLLINNTRFPPQGSALPTSTSPQGNGSQVATAEERQEEISAASVEWSPSVAGAVTAAADVEGKKDAEEISEETLNFWKGIADVGLMGEVVSNIRTELLALLRGVQLRSGQAALQEPDAAVLHSLAQMFGLLDCVKRALQNRRSQAGQNQELLHSTLVELERQLEEQKKQAQDWRPRSQPSVALVPLAGSSKPPAPKRPRLQRPASTSVLSVSPSQQQVHQITVLSPITMSSAGQSFSIAGLPVTTLGQLPAGTQLVTRYAMGAGHTKADSVTLHPSSSLTLLSAAAMANQGQLGPVEIVHLAQEAEAGNGEDQQGGSADGEMVGGALLVQEGVGGEEEAQAHTTVIEIDPAPSDHATGVVGLRLGGEAAVVVQAEMEVMDGAEAEEEGGVVLQGGIEIVGGTEGNEEGGVVLQGGMEVVGGAEIDEEGEMVLHGGMAMVGGAETDAGLVVHAEMEELEHQEQLHSVEIVVIEDEVAK
ncbi:glucocorticoid modulatory element-binding protein 1 isoform X2 [Paramormyrops kingsleyae]|uniref:Glucocorticoid modulatory element binding protein 1 n=2 Tax=Paramormyrops kingsleyae TaxID=1676925 RepID=A0A3B3QD58_9TELE|nr:glucocorticoid modulatory element-binding protein 1 isoform X2 [Paramormyrops kingsleyae]